MAVKICSIEFDPWQEIQSYQQELVAGSFGATQVFIGSMRDFNDGDVIEAMYLEHYPGMTERQLEKIIAEASLQWQIIDALVVHRVGDVLPSQAIVLVAIWSVHRGDAFDAGRYIMEALKSTAPFWKKERLSTDQGRWVGKNTDGYATQKKTD